MKALILAGGHGTRLWPVTKEKAKCLLPLAGKPIVDYLLQDLEGMAAIYISTNKLFAPQFNKFIKNKGYDVELLVEEHRKEEEKYGSVGGIIRNIRSVSKDDWLIVSGDNYLDLSFSDFLQWAKKSRSVANACYKVSSLKEAKLYGVVRLENSRIKELKEKPAKPKSRLVSIGFYWFPKKKLKLLKEYEKKFKGKKEAFDEPGRLLSWLAENYKVYGYPFKGKWFDIGNREEYLKAEQKLQPKQIVKGKVRSSKLIGTVSIQPGCTVKNSIIKNSIILENSSIIDSKIEDCIVSEGSQIKGKKLARKLI